MNQEFIACWNEVLVPRWQRFRHLSSANGGVHSDIADEHFDIRKGDRVLDIGCGFGETCLKLARRVGPTGAVTGLDCTGAFLETADTERLAAGIDNVDYELGDAQTHALPEQAYDVVYSRFAMALLQDRSVALRNVRDAMKPGGRLCLIVWRTLEDNPCWELARQVVCEQLPLTGGEAETGAASAFSLAGEQATRTLLAASGFHDVRLFLRIDADICIGHDLAEATEYQLSVSPASELVRAAGGGADAQLPAIREALQTLFRRYQREDGCIYMPSGTWAIMAVAAP